MSDIIKTPPSEQAETYFVQNFEVIQNLAFILTSEVTRQSSKAFFVYS